jgi:hypothetical protein
MLHAFSINQVKVVDTHGDKHLGTEGVYIIFALHKQPVEEDQIAGEYLDCFKTWIITPIKRTPL